MSTSDLWLSLHTGHYLFITLDLLGKMMLNPEKFSCQTNSLWLYSWQMPGVLLLNCVIALSNSKAMKNLEYLFRISHHIGRKGVGPWAVFVTQMFTLPAVTMSLDCGHTMGLIVMSMLEKLKHLWEWPHWVSSHDSCSILLLSPPSSGIMRSAGTEWGARTGQRNDEWWPGGPQWIVISVNSRILNFHNIFSNTFL